MKTVFTNAEIVHVWAAQKQDAGRANSMRFDGATIYSYRMPIGQFVTDPQGNTFVLLNRTSRSVTTSEHQSNVASAVSHLRTIEVFEITSSVSYSSRNKSGYMDAIETSIKKAARAREQWSQDSHLVRARYLAQAMTDYCGVFNLDWEIPVIPLDLAAAKIQVKTESKEKAEKTRLANIEAMKKAVILREQWLDGGRMEYGWVSFLPTELRIVDSEIETSKGASFPLSHAKRGLILVESVIASGIEWKRNGHTCHLGHYQIDRIESDGTVHAGCHVVPYNAIARIREAVLAYVPTVESEVA